MKFKFQVTGSKMKESVLIEVVGITGLQAIVKAKEEANKQNLEWDEIEYI